MTEQNPGAQGTQPRPDDAAPAAAPADAPTTAGPTTDAPTTATPTTDAPTTAAPAPSPGEQPTQQVAAAPPGDQGPAEPATQHMAAAPAEPETRQMPEPVVAPAGDTRQGGGVGRAVRSVARRIAMLLRLVGGLIALVLVVFIVLAVLDVNEQNSFAQVVAGLADTFVLDFRDLFLPDDERVLVAVNYGLAAVFWLVVSAVAASVVQRLARLVP